MTDKALDSRDISSMLEERPFAIVLPLSLERYDSLRIAELVALHRLHIRLILVSGTSASGTLLAELFDCQLPAHGEGLPEALLRSEWTHAFERRTVSLEVAIQNILCAASCFWMNRHAFSFPTLVDYHKRFTGDARHYTVLFVVADPTDGARLCLMKELAAIEQELARRSAYSFSLRYVFSSRPDELMRRISEEKPHIVHFSGHGNEHGQLCFEHPDGRTWPADKLAIAQIFATSRRYVKCVVLNCCFSAEQARLIGQYIEYAIGMNSNVTDEAAIAMSKAFYSVLGSTGRVSSAIISARASLRLISGNFVGLYSAERVPEFQGLLEKKADKTSRDSTISERLANMDHISDGHVRVPILRGARCFTDSSDTPSAGLSAEFVTHGTIDEMMEFYKRWAHHSAWLTQDDGTGGDDRSFLCLMNETHILKIICHREDRPYDYVRLRIVLLRSDFVRVE